MANFVHNVLVIVGNEEQLLQFRSKSFVTKIIKLVNVPEFEKKDCFSFAGLCPTPKELLDPNCAALNGSFYRRPEKSGTNVKEQFALEVNELERKYSYPNWYDWQIANWGVSRDAIPVEQNPYGSYIRNESHRHLTIEYDTRYSTPTKWLHYVSGLFPELKFRNLYSEFDINFCGVEYYVNKLKDEVYGDARLLYMDYCEIEDEEKALAYIQKEKYKFFSKVRKLDLKYGFETSPMQLPHY